MEADYAIIGGGVVGLSVAWGLLKRGRSVVVIDGDDGSLRASRGNGGLIWVQSKGMDQPHYARWSQRSAAAWAEFANELGDGTGMELPVEQRGGYDFHFSQESLEAKVERYNRLKKELDGDYPFDVLGHNELRREEPEIGSSVVGAILHHQDGHTNPLKLLKMLAFDVRRMGGRVLTGSNVVDVTQDTGFRLHCANGTIVEAEKTVLAAGLGSAVLGQKLGFKAPIGPERGQLMITEKVSPGRINRPSEFARQVDEGGIQLFVTNEDVGYNDDVTLDAMSWIAERVIGVFPFLGRLQLVRSWGALRVLTPDRLPIYQASKHMPGAYLVTCHSGITLAAAHSRFLPDWLENTEHAPNLEVFSEDRFTSFS